jgi:pSer/pThr/pTyr-binding forkhead associated (FHA) protein
MKAQLEIKDGALAGTKVELGKLGSFTIGRRSENDLSLVEKAVSRHHCRIDYDGEFYWLVDCDSHNGTFVNGRKITKCLLYDGDVVKLGHMRLVFLMPGQEEKGSDSP